MNSTNIDVSGIKQLFKPFEKKYINYYDKYNNNQIVSKICLHNFFLANDIKICNIIRNIPCYNYRFDIIYDNNDVSIGEFNGKIFNKININDNQYTDLNNKLHLIQYKNNGYILFNEHLLQLKTPKSFIFFVLTSYRYLLDSLIELHDRNICYIDFSPNNILIPYQCREKPILSYFQNSLTFNDLNIQNISNIIDNIDDYTYKPLELYVLFYIVNNNLNTLSISLIEEICNYYVEKLTILSLFSQEYRKNFKNTCINTLKLYINKPKNLIIEEIVKYHSSWSNYGLSLLYLNIVGNVLRIFNCNNILFKNLVVIFSNNISANPLQRENLKNTLVKYELLFNEFCNWDFVNTLSAEKMKYLFKYIMNKYN